MAAAETLLGVAADAQEDTGEGLLNVDGGQETEDGDSTENPEELAKWLLEFYRKIYGKTTKIQEESLVTISLEELNQYWYEAKQKWRLL